MRNRDSVTCAAQPACGCGTVQTASVFRAVDSCAPCSNNGTDWNHWDRNMHRSGCCGSRSGGDGCNAWGTAGVNECCSNGCATAADHSWGNSCDACGTAAAINCNPCAAAANTGCAACTRCGNSPCTCHSNGCTAAANSCNACAVTADCNPCAAVANTGCAACTRCGNSPCTCHSNGCTAAANSCNACASAANCNPCAAAANTGCAACTRCGNNPCTCGLTPAMVYETPHGLNALHGFEEAIRKGTLFGELYMPMNGECADNCGARLCDGQAEAFAAWELRLYLNTHPWDRHALELFRQCCRRGDLPNYACAFASDDGCADRWRWTDAPWPWELGSTCENNCGCH